MAKKKETSAPGEQKREFQRARWKHIVRLFGLFIVVTLNISLVLSNLRLMMSYRMDLGHALFSFAILIVLDVLFLLPTIFEVDSVVVTPDSLNLNALLWRAKLPWSQVLSCNKPTYLAFAIVKTARCFYLINKRDIPDFADLLETIRFQLEKEQKCITS